MLPPSSRRRTAPTGRARALSVSLALWAGLLVTSLAAAQTNDPPVQTGEPVAACADREIEIESAGVGVVRAETLDTEGGDEGAEVAVLGRACFGLGDLAFDAARLRVTETSFRAEDVDISGPELRGRTGVLRAEGDLTAFEGGLTLDLALPSTALPGVPLPAGRYALTADTARLQGATFRFGDATLVREGDGQTYRLVNAELTGARLTADRVLLGRVDAQDVRLQPSLLQAGPTRIGLCRDPGARELELRAGSVLVSPGGAVLTDARLAVFGLGLPLPGALELPITARGADLAATATSINSDSERLAARLAGAGLQLVARGDAFGLRDVPLLDERDTRLNMVLHDDFLEFGVRTRLGVYDASLGIFEDPGDLSPLPQATLTSTPASGPQVRFVLRGDGKLSEASSGYAVRGTLGAGGTRGAARLLAEGGMVNQLGVADAFVRAAAEIDGSTTAGAFGLGARAFVDAYRFTADTQVAAELSVRATAGVAVAGGTVGVSAEQFERLVWGAAPVADLRAAPARTTGVSAAYDAPSSGGGPSLRRVAYTYTYDWRTNRASAHAASVTAALRVGTADVTPTLSYDVVRDRAALATDVTLYSDCFAYGGTVEVSAERGVFGVSARLKFGLR